jgi:hypothetical protein
MITSVSFLAFRLSSYCDDSITVGQFYSDENGKVTLLVSDERLKLLRKIIARPLYLNFIKFIKNCNKHNLVYSDLDYHSRYQNGIIKITYPSPFAGDITMAEEVFNKYIKDNYKTHYENSIIK